MKVVVVGGGLAGLFTASELLSSGVDDVTVVEASPHPGGVVRTIERDGFSLEPGAGSFTLPHPHLGPILERAGVATEPAETRARYLFAAGRLVEVQASPRALLTPVLPLSAKLRALAEPLVPARPGTDETLAAFCRRRFGDRAGEMLASLLASGVHAGDPERLSCAAAFPPLDLAERDAGSVLMAALRRRRARPEETPPPTAHVAPDGMASMAGKIAETIGDRFRPGFRVDSVHSQDDRWAVSGPEQLTADRVVVAVGPRQASGMVDSELARHLSGAAAAPVAVVGLGGSGPAPFPPGFGALIAPGREMITIGVLFESSYAPGRAPSGSWLMKVIAGGATRPDAARWSDERLRSAVIGEVGEIVGLDSTPSFVEVARPRPGIPQYESGHLEWLRGIDSLLETRPGLYLTGWGYRGVGVTSLAKEATRLVREIIE